ncbi:hypothetical protein GJ688_05575 [Heliobacillus mobilis]|uniref:Uncharacterized protein n=1 Tax=Heliobacterium mobile TaxID=28064 RepID=A0A6I3SHU6_HELMO|nr:hypothetical protein [Heliobacterium mobile]
MVPVRIQVLMGQYATLEEPLVFSFSEDKPPLPARFQLELDKIGGEAVHLNSVIAEYRGAHCSFRNEEVRINMEIALSIVLKSPRGTFTLVQRNYRANWHRTWGEMLPERREITDPGRWTAQLEVGPIHCEIVHWHRQGSQLLLEVLGRGPMKISLYEWCDVDVNVSAKSSAEGYGEGDRPQPETPRVKANPKVQALPGTKVAKRLLKGKREQSEQRANEATASSTTALPTDVMKVAQRPFEEAERRAIPVPSISLADGSLRRPADSPGRTMGKSLWGMTGPATAERQWEHRLIQLQRQMAEKERKVAELMTELQQTRAEQERLKQENQNIIRRMEEQQMRGQRFFSRVFGRTGA